MNRLYFWKPVGGYTYLVKWRGRWHFWGTGPACEKMLLLFARQRGLSLINCPGPKDRPPTLSEMKTRYPLLEVTQ